jgi:plastocyanin
MRTRTTVTLLAATLGCTAAAGIARAQRGHAPAVARTAAKTTTVRLGDYFFRSKTITITAGSSVRFVNTGKIEHTVADSTKSGSTQSKLIHPRPLKHGATQTVRFRKRGKIYYICTFHPGLMRGVIIVQ